MHAKTPAVMSRALLASALVTLAACGGGGGGGEAAPPAAFRVVALDPVDGAAGVALRKAVTATFSMPVDPATLGTRPIDVGILTESRIQGSCEVVDDGLGTSVRFNPSEAMLGNTTYTVFVLASIRAGSGDALGGSTQFQFRTAGGVDLPLQNQLRATNGDLVTGRRNHTATRLQGGRVLVAGGYDQSTHTIDRAELFDPWAETFSEVGSRMTHARAQHTATLLADGRVLLAGGLEEVSPGSLTSTSSAEVFDPATSSFQAVGDMGQSRADAAALALPDGRVLVTGGGRFDGAWTDFGDAEVFDPATESWSPWPQAMSHTRATHGMVDLGDGRWFLAGGSWSDLRCETLDLTTGAFTPLSVATADAARWGASVATFASGSASVVGGDTVGSVLYFARPYDVVWNTGSGTNRPRAYATATRYAADRLLVVGGIDFSTNAILPTVDVVVEGGAVGSQTYATSIRFPTGMANHTATVLATGKILFCGGANTYGQLELDGAYLFTP